MTFAVGDVVLAIWYGPGPHNGLPVTAMIVDHDDEARDGKRYCLFYEDSTLQELAESVGSWLWVSERTIWEKKA